MSRILSYMKRSDSHSPMPELVGSRFIVEEEWLQHFKVTEIFHESFFLQDARQREIIKNIYMSALNQGFFLIWSHNVCEK